MATVKEYKVVVYTADRKRLEVFVKAAGSGPARRQVEAQYPGARIGSVTERR
jgi:hypothetical protein